MIQKLTISPRQVSDYTCVAINSQGPLSGFPFLSIDRDSYLVGVEVQSGINFDPVGGRHCIAIGKGCSLAESITFMIDLNHDYASVCQGELSFLPKSPSCGRAPRKGSIILQNDVWIGHGATIMAGVTLHNGCVVAADAVITKDVPPYAIVGGNPAKILRCRFDKDTIDSLQKIAWWDWPLKTQQLRRDDFLLPAPEFAAKYLPEAEARLRKSQTVPPPDIGRGNCPHTGYSPGDSGFFRRIPSLSQNIRAVFFKGPSKSDTFDLFIRRGFHTRESRRHTTNFTAA